MTVVAEYAWLDSAARRLGRVMAAFFFSIVVLACSRGSEATPLTLVSTHTLEDSGLLDSLLADFRRAYPEQRVRLVVVGSGEALAIGKRGDADVLLTHSPAAEQDFVRAGYGTSRRELMYNDFLVLGPPADPAGARDAPNAAAAFDSIRAQGEAFVSRADDSGTHVMEQAIWARTGRPPAWDGYLETGVGMGDALRIASERVAYVLADRATWSVLRDQLELAPVHEGDPLLRNVYAITKVANARDSVGAALLASWLETPEARRRITNYRGGGLFRIVAP